MGITNTAVLHCLHLDGGLKSDFRNLRATQRDKNMISSFVSQGIISKIF